MENSLKFKNNPQT